jgi:hypothetical protein
VSRQLLQQIPSTTTGEQLARRLADLEARVKQLESQLQGGAVLRVPVVTALPTAGSKGRVVMLDSDSLLYRDNGAAWVAV